MWLWVKRGRRFQEGSFCFSSMCYWFNLFLLVIGLINMFRSSVLNFSVSCAKHVTTINLYMINQMYDMVGLGY